MRKHLALAFLMLVSLPIAVRAQEPLAQKIVYDYSKMYDDLNPSIVKIHADSRTGSGFLVSKEGLIATNHHVVANARFVAVQFADGRKVKAEIVVLNPRYDVAVLKVNHSLVSNMQPLRLLPAERDASVKAGVPVVAFGSPLSQTFLMTQGIVSKVEDNVLLGDFLIEPGNSGGPLLTLNGEVIGINTFLLRNISGAVRVRLLRDTLARSDVSQNAGDEPPADLLPTIKQKGYPTEVLKEKILAEKLDWEAYRFDGGKFVVTVITPVLVGKAQVQDDLMRASNRYKRRGKRIKDPSYQAIDEPFYEWQRNAASELQSAVTFEIKPDFGLTTGSKWALGLAALGGARTVQQTHLNMEFKSEFWDFKVYRDGQLVQPITAGRAITESTFASAQATFVDEAYSGMFVYDPETFLTGNEFRFEIYDAREPEKVHKTVTLKADSKLIRQIRSDFASAVEK
jgi:Trypsin-like peptidase domain